LAREAEDLLRVLSLRPEMSRVFILFLFLMVLNLASRTCFWLGMGRSPFVFCARPGREKHTNTTKGPIVFKAFPKNFVVCITPSKMLLLKEAKLTKKGQTLFLNVFGLPVGFNGRPKGKFCVAP